MFGFEEFSEESNNKERCILTVSRVIQSYSSITYSVVHIIHVVYVHIFTVEQLSTVLQLMLHAVLRFEHILGDALPAGMCRFYTRLNDFRSCGFTVLL